MLLLAAGAFQCGFAVMDTTIGASGGAGIVDESYYVKVSSVGNPNQVQVSTALAVGMVFVLLYCCMHS